MEEEGEEGGFPPPGWRGFEGEDFKGREKRRKAGQGMTGAPLPRGGKERRRRLPGRRLMPAGHNKKCSRSRGNLS